MTTARQTLSPATKVSSCHGTQSAKGSSTNLTKSTKKSLRWMGHKITLAKVQGQKSRQQSRSILFCQAMFPYWYVLCQHHWPGDIFCFWALHHALHLFSCTTSCSSLLEPHKVWETVALSLHSPFKTFFFFLESTLGPLSFHVNFRVSPNTPKTQIKSH